MADNVNVAGRFVYNVSPTKKGPKKEYFDFYLQTGKTSTVRSVCFSTGKRKFFVDTEKKSTPVKIAKFVRDKGESTNILIGDGVVVEKLKESEVDFEKNAAGSMNINLSTLHMVSVNQLVTLKAKVVNLQPGTTRRTKLMKAEAQLVDRMCFETCG